MSSMRQAKYERAKAYILAHPDESKAQQSIGADVSVALIAMVRKDLVAAKLLPPDRKAPPVAPPPPPAPPPAESLPVSKPPGMLDHDALVAMADMVDLDTLDDAEVHKKLLKQCLRFAFDPKLHPDTRMSASTMWGKLRDMAKAKDLGPGAPVTREDAVARLTDIMRACGPEITLAAVNAAFEVKDDPTNQQAEDAGGTPQPPQSPGRDDPPPQAEDLR